MIYRTYVQTPFYPSHLPFLFSSGVIGDESFRNNYLEQKYVLLPKKQKNRGVTKIVFAHTSSTSCQNFIQN